MTSERLEEHEENLRSLLRDLQTQVTHTLPATDEGKRIVVYNHVPNSFDSPCTVIVYLFVFFRGVKKRCLSG